LIFLANFIFFMNRRTFIRQTALLAGGCGFFLKPGLLASQTPAQTPALRLIVDADTANEVDDLFAIAIALLEPGLKVVGLSSAQWHTQQRAPNDSVGASQRLNEQILQLMGKTHIPHPQGSNIPLVNEQRPQPSAAADFIIAQALKTPEGEKLHVAILGPCTNLASAILLEPAIAPKVSAHYIGFWHHPPTRTWSKREFNTNNDPNAVNVLLNNPQLEFHLMTASTAQHLVYEKTEVDAHLKGKGGIGDFLVNYWENYDRYWSPVDKEKKRWIMWDIAVIEALARPELATQVAVTTPHDNLEREIFAYTHIEVEKMKANYWQLFDGFFKN